MNDLNGIHALSHTTWNCKYHIVFALKYRRKVFLEENEGKDDFIVRLTGKRMLLFKGKSKKIEEVSAQRKGKIRMNMYFREGDKEAYVSHT